MTTLGTGHNILYITNTTTQHIKYTQGWTGYLTGLILRAPLSWFCKDQLGRDNERLSFNGNYNEGSTY